MIFIYVYNELFQIYPSEYFLSNCISCVGSHCFKSLRKFEFRTIEPERYRIESERKKA